MTPNWRIMGAAAFFVVGAAGAAAGAPTCNNPEILHLAGLRAGGSSAVLERRSNVSTDRTACYRLNIPAADRTLSVRLFSDNTAGFLQLYSPDWTAKRVDGAWVFTGSSLPGAGASDHAAKWKGPAPIGNILIVVDMSGGAGRQYRLRLETQ